MARGFLGLRDRHSQEFNLAILPGYVILMDQEGEALHDAFFTIEVFAFDQGHDSSDSYFKTRVLKLAFSDQRANLL